MRSICINTRLLLKDRLEGIGFHIVEILKILTQKHPDITFHCVFDRPWDTSFKVSDNIECHWMYPPTRHPILIRAWYDYSLPLIFKRIKPKVFWSPDNFLSLKTQVPTVLTVHDLAYRHVSAGVPSREQKFYQQYMPLFLDKADHILCVSEATKKDVIELSDKPDGQVSVCYNGCRSEFSPLSDDQKKIARDKYSDGHPYFLYLGSMHPRKNLSRLIKAYSQFRENQEMPYKLILAGRNAWMVDDIDKAIQSSKYKSDIILINRYVDIDEAAALVGACFCMLYVSLFEGFGIPILEGLQAGVPVITSTSSSMPEVGGEAVLYADPLSVQSIAKQMSRLAHSPDLIDQLLYQGELQVKKFSWHNTADIVFKELAEFL